MPGFDVDNLLQLTVFISALRCHIKISNRTFPTFNKLIESRKFDYVSKNNGANYLKPDDKLNLTNKEKIFSNEFTSRKVRKK